jgi:phosphatidylinositol alpha 1,6-mannosyltransferase
MRITLVTETFFPAVDGTTTTVKAVVDRLVDTGHQVQLVAPGPGLASYRGCPVARVRPIDKPGRQVREALEAFRPDLLHVTSPATLGRKALTYGERLDRVAELGGTAALWAPGVDTAAFTPALRDTWLHDRWSRARSRPRPLVVVGYVGSLRKRHDVRRLAELAKVPGIRPVIVGDGPQRAWLAGRLPDAKLTGALGTGDLAAVLPTLDVLVHPAPRSGGALDAVRHLETGLLHDPHDARDFRRAVGALVADGRRGLLGDRGRELSTRSWTDAVDELVATHYRRLVPRHPALTDTRR